MYVTAPTCELKPTRSDPLTVADMLCPNSTGPRTNTRKLNLKRAQPYIVVLQYPLNSKAQEPNQQSWNTGEATPTDSDQSEYGTNRSSRTTPHAVWSGTENSPGEGQYIIQLKVIAYSLPRLLT